MIALLSGHSVSATCWCLRIELRYYSNTRNGESVSFSKHPVGCASVFCVELLSGSHTGQGVSDLTARLINCGSSQLVKPT